MATPFFTAQALQSAATLRLAPSSVALVASGYESFLRPGDARVSRSPAAFCSKADRDGR